MGEREQVQKEGSGVQQQIWWLWPLVIKSSSFVLSQWMRRPLKLFEISRCILTKFIALFLPIAWQHRFCGSLEALTSFLLYASLSLYPQESDFYWSSYDGFSQKRHSLSLLEDSKISCLLLKGKVFLCSCIHLQLWLLMYEP